MRFAPKQVVVIGAGSIGTEFSKQAKVAGWNVSAMVNSRGATGAYPVTFRTRGDSEEIEKFVNHLSRYVRPDLAVFALPSGGDGSTELAYMMPFLKSGVSVVTAGKSAVAGQYDKLAPFLGKVGMTATVGGGTRILHFLKQWLDPSQPFDLGLVINGTMSYIMCRIWQGDSLEVALKGAIAMKFAEPPEEGEALSPLKVFRGEIEDVARKIAIILNELGYPETGRGCRQDDLKMVPLDEDHLRAVTRPDARMKYVVWMTRLRGGTSEESMVDFDPEAPGSVSGQFGPFSVGGGFCFIPERSALANWVPNDGAGNAMLVLQKGNKLVMSGPGAGPPPTAASMMFDAERLTGGREQVVPVRWPWAEFPGGGKNVVTEPIGDNCLTRDPVQDPRADDFARTRP